jgi:outer membrane lipase/esterase
MKFRAALLATAAVIAAAPLTLLASAANAQSFSNTIFFGDSSSDSGRYLYVSPTGVRCPAPGCAPAGTGAYTTNPGPEWSVALGQKFGITVTPQDAPGGGNNYAAGGALVSGLPNPADTGEWSATQQVAAYVASTGGHADPNALYVMWIGVNDLKSTSSPDILGNDPAIAALAQQTVNLVDLLHSAGAQYIVVPNLYAPTIGLFVAGSGEINSRALYAQDEWNGLASAGINFIPADITTLTNYVLHNPAQFGITNISAPACGPTTNAYQCGPANYVTPNAPQTYFYTDGPAAPDGGGHLTTAGQLIEADYIYSLIVAPSEISYLAEVPVKTRATMVDSIFQQIAISERQRAVGTYNAWITGDLSSLRMGNSYNGFPTDPGTPGMVTVGADYLWSPHWLVGGALSVGTTTQDFSIGGNFRQNEFALSGYSAYAAGPFWFDMIGTYGGLRYDVNRIVPLGIVMVSNTGNTGGSNVSFASEIGYNFLLPLSSGVAPAPLPVKAPPPPVASLYLTHGPVAGILLQRIYVDGFTETDSLGGVTALSYADQIRNSAVTELGYQAHVDIGIWSPYAKLTWNHELVPYDRSVTASLTTVTAPSYYMPAVVFGKDWASATIGTTAAIGRGMTAYASFNSQMGQNNVTYYGGQIGLNVALNSPAPPIATK